jgi:hypothetical protein
MAAASNLAFFVLSTSSWIVRFTSTRVLLVRTSAPVRVANLALAAAWVYPLAAVRTAEPALVRAPVTDRTVVDDHRVVDRHLVGPVGYYLVRLDLGSRAHHSARQDVSRRGHCPREDRRGVQLGELLVGCPLQVARGLRQNVRPASSQRAGDREVPVGLDVSVELGRPRVPELGDDVLGGARKRIRSPQSQ